METLSKTKKVTPAGRLVLSSSAPREEWLQARRSGIAATDLVAILGLSKYRTAFDVWTDKVMEPEFDDSLSEAGVWGNRLEDPVAQEWAERAGLKIRRIGLIANEEHPWAIASLDRLVTGCPDGRCALEVKTRNLFAAASWEHSVPEDVIVQVRWQLLVSGLDHVHVAALIGGQRLVDHVVGRDPEHEQRLLEAARLVWDSIQSQTPPDLPVELWTSDFLDQRYPEREGQVDVPVEALDSVAEYDRLSRKIKDLTDEREKVRTRLVGFLGDGEVAVLDGIPLYSFTASKSRRLNSKALTERYPTIADDPAVWSESVSRTLRVSKKGNDK